MRIFQSLMRRFIGALASYRLQGIACFALFCGIVPASAQAVFLGSQTQLSGVTLSAPGGIAADGTGNLYIADTGNDRVVEIAYSASGYASAVTILSGLSAPAGLAADWYGNIYVADTGNNRIVKLPVAASGFAAPVTVASGLDAPASVAADSVGNLFIADTGNNRVLELPTLGAGFGSPLVIGSGFSAPQGVAVDTSRNVYIADTGNNRIEKLLYSTTGYVTQQLAVRSLVSPIAIAVDNSFNLYIIQAGYQAILEEVWLPGAGRFNSTNYTGSGFVSPSGVAADSHGSLWVTDASVSEPWQIVASALSFPAAAANSSGSVINYNFNLAAGTALGSVGILFQGASGRDFADSGGSTCLPQTYATAAVCSVHVQFHPLGSGTRSGAVVLYDPLGNVLSTSYFFGSGSASRLAFFPASESIVATQLSGPSGVAVDGSGDLYIADTGNNRILELSAAGGSPGTPVALDVIQLNSPMGLAIDGAGNLYIASNGNDKVVKLAWTGTAFAAQSKIATAFYAPSAVNFDGAGDLFVADSYDDHIVKLPWTGNGYAAPVNPGTYARIPVGVTVDNNGNVYFSMPYSNAVVQVALIAGKYLPNRYLSLNNVVFPTAVICDGNSNLYVLDTGNNRVVMFPWTGSGFGAQVTVATGFNAPAGMAIDGVGNLYVADTGNNQVVRINLAQPAPVTFATTYVGSVSSDSAQVVTLQNTGSLSLSVDSVHYPADFPENGGAANDCGDGDSLAAGGGCTLSIDFLPRTAGNPLSEELNVDSASAASGSISQTVSVTGAALSQKPQSIMFAAIPNTTYGASSPIALSASATSGLPVTYQVVSGPAILSSGSKSVSIRGAGVIVLQALQPGNGIYSAAEPVLRTFIVVPALLTVTPANVSALYGAIPSTFAYSITGLLYGQTPAQAITGTPVIAPAVGSAGVGMHSLLAAVGTLQAANYTFAFVPGTLTVKPATLQITAASASMIYGSTVPPLTWSAKGFVNGDTQSVVSGTPLLTTPAGISASTGSYPIVPTRGTLAASNYTFTFINGTLSVTTAVLTVRAQSQTKVYGSALPALSYAITGFRSTDTVLTAVHGVPALVTAATAHSGVGSYAITASTGTLGATNYTFSFAGGTLSVTRAPLTISPLPMAMVYGSALPAIKSWQAAGLLNGDTASSALSGSPLLSTSATSATAPGTAAIAIAPGTLTAANYSLSFVPGALTIDKAALTVRPSAITRLYGQANPALAYTLTGFVNGDTSVQVSGTPVLTTAATVASPAGAYGINSAIGTLASSRYAFTLAASSLTVNRAVLTVTAAATSRVYGSPMPALVYSVTGFVNGDQAVVVSGAPVLSTAATAASGAGVYLITAAQGGLSAANYIFTCVSGQLTVAKASVKVTANNQSVAAGSALPTFTYTVTGLVNGDTTLTAFLGSPKLTTTASSSSAAGSYAITISAGTMTAKNYALTFVNGTLTLTQATSSVYNPQPPAKHLPPTTIH